MAHAQSSVFAPTWLRCAGCTIAMMPFVALVGIIGLGRESAAVVAAIVPSALLFKYGLNILITGRPSSSLFCKSGNATIGRLRGRRVGSDS